MNRKYWTVVKNGCTFYGIVYIKAFVMSALKPGVFNISVKINY